MILALGHKTKALMTAIRKPQIYTESRSHPSMTITLAYTRRYDLGRSTPLYRAGGGIGRKDQRIC